MCGIGGVWLRAGAEPLDLADTLDRMNRRLAHRGPDDHGTWSDPQVGVGLCHTRLAILDLSPAGHQPMMSSDGRLAVTYNGEIYNWPDLRRRLEAHGARFRGASDTEVLLEAYRMYGTDVLRHLRGMFSFALFDRREGILFCARDRVGKKPFVYSEMSGAFVFGSEVPAVLAVPGCDTTLDHAGVAALLLHNVRHVPDPWTAYRGLRRLRPGHAMIVRAGRIARVWRYWTPEAEPRPVTPAELRHVLEESVRLRMAADVPVGALLSGGVDSSAVVGLMTRLSNKPIRTYALGFDAQDEDLHRARTMARRFDCQHREFYFEPTRQLAVFRKILATYGEPVMLLPLIHIYELCRAVREDGLKVVLTGNGADELFCGYTGHLRTARHTAWLMRLGRFTAGARIVPRSLRRRSVAVLAARPGARKAALYQAAERTAWDRVVAPEVRVVLQNAVAEEAAYWGQFAAKRPYIDESNLVALMCENAHSVTIAGDLPSMMTSVEMRAPFLDQELVSLALAMHYREKVPDSRRPERLKQILKTAVADVVPEDVLYGSKRGFGFGIQERDVLAGPWRDVADELFREPDDADGLFVRREVGRLWKDRNARNKGSSSSSEIAKHFAIQLWLHERRKAELSAPV
jgi:asparagine synthase (glutamine-hydrolysing)